MSCSFDLDHYAELLDAAQAGGYRWAFFDHEPKPGDVFLRHDVDLSFDAALRLARVEREHDATATYFLMTESVFYNLASSEGRNAIAELRELGHAVGLHAVHPNATRDERFDAVLAWHNPDPEYVSEPVDGAVNVMQPPWFTQGKYRSDSNAHWREGCPHEELRAGAFEWLQLLTHPEIWVYPGVTMGETMRSMLDAKREEWLDQLANDRIDLA
jgi:peptidoglycan/xylan/chitin deacetylase (PgdA/CDA1 family)